MAIAVVCAAFDQAANRHIAEVRELIRSLGGKAARKPAHRPHVTLSAASVDSVRPILTLARRIAKRHDPFQMRLSVVDTFGRGDVVWLGPTRSPSPLVALHRDTYATLVDAGYPPAFAGQSSPRDWRAHSTIARRMSPEVLDALRAAFEPIEVTVDAVATIVVGGSDDVGYAPLG